MASPRPVPPKRRVVSSSAWLKAPKMTASLSRGMPMPVSCTAKVSVSASRCTPSRIVPRVVNLIALPSRLRRICSSLVRSDDMLASPGPRSTISRLSRSITSGRTVPTTSSIRASTGKSSTSSSTLPASIFDRSSGVLDQRQQVPPGADDPVQVGELMWAEGRAALLAQQLAVADDRVERRAQLVAHVGQEGALGPAGGQRPVERLGERLAAATQLVAHDIEADHQRVDGPVILLARVQLAVEVQRGHRGDDLQDLVEPGIKVVQRACQRDGRACQFADCRLDAATRRELADDPPQVREQCLGVNQPTPLLPSGGPPTLTPRPLSPSSLQMRAQRLLRRATVLKAMSLWTGFGAAWRPRAQGCARVGFRRAPCGGGRRCLSSGAHAREDPQQGPHPRRRSGRVHRGDLRRPVQPRADHGLRARAGRPADDHHRGRELPGLPQGHHRPGDDGGVPRAGRALRHQVVL